MGSSATVAGNQGKVTSKNKMRSTEFWSKKKK
jgi:hypothetical protein